LKLALPLAVETLRVVKRRSQTLHACPTMLPGEHAELSIATLRLMVRKGYQPSKEEPLKSQNPNKRALVRTAAR